MSTLPFHKCPTYADSAQGKNATGPGVRAHYNAEFGQVLVSQKTTSLGLPFLFLRSRQEDEKRNSCNHELLKESEDKNVIDE